MKRHKRIGFRFRKNRIIRVTYLKDLLRRTARGKYLSQISNTFKVLDYKCLNLEVFDLAIALVVIHAVLTSS